MKQDILNDLKALSDPKRVAANKWFFKTGIGEYGYGDEFLGIRVPSIRSVVRKYPNCSLNEIETLLHNNFHEVRLCAVLLLVQKYKCDPEGVYAMYLANTKYINNWDLVDSSAGYIVGKYLENKPKSILHKLAKSDSIWERRIAMISTFCYIRKGDDTEAFKIINILLHDKHDLIQKAVGWMLREIGKSCSLKDLEDFLDKNADNMPRTTLRYAIEHFDKSKRLAYLKGGEYNVKRIS